MLTALLVQAAGNAQRHVQSVEWREVRLQDEQWAESMFANHRLLLLDAVDHLVGTHAVPSDCAN